MKNLLYVCVTCRRYEGAHCKGALPPPLPEFRVSETRSFQTTGVDYAGPMYVKTPDNPRNTVQGMDDPLYVLFHQSCPPRPSPGHDSGDLHEKF